MFVWHRQAFDVLRPYVSMNEQEISDLKSNPVYCAGFTDPQVRDRDDLYDLFLDCMYPISFTYYYFFCFFLFSNLFLNNLFVVDNRSRIINPNSKGKIDLNV